MSQEKIPVLFDTDIGSDIDDAACLAYLLSEPRCELVGITTVTGEAVERAKLASALCKAAGRDDIPIHSGTENPLLIPLKQKAAPQKEKLVNWPHRESFPENTAIEFMRDVIESRPGEVTLLAVGPFTNVGLLFATYPETAGKLKQLVVMGGVFTNRPMAGPLEWNAIGDPHATAILYNAPVPIHVSIGLDVTTQVRLEAAEVNRRFAGGLLDVVRDMAEVWFRNTSVLTFHDPLAAVSIFEPDICKYRRGVVSVELVSQRLQGYTYWDSTEIEFASPIEPAEPGKRHYVALDVDVEGFFRKYFSVFA
ncbi:MAG: nucleoside hydrolase [Firmicutes bacterium]|nr:nucleoside hydrolase [Bacillota bacterium]